MSSIKEHLLNFDSSSNKVFLVLWGAMLIVYCSGFSSELQYDQVGMAKLLCGDALGVKDSFVFPAFCAIGLSVVLIVVFVAWGVYPSEIPRLSPKGVSVSAAAFLVAALCIFLATSFFPCAGAGSPSNGMGLSKYGGGLVALAQKNFPIYSFLHSILMWCFYRGCVISIKAGRV